MKRRLIHFSCAAGIDFLDVTNLDECITFYRKETHAPSKLFSLSPSEILYEEMNSSNVLYRLDC